MTAEHHLIDTLLWAFACLVFLLVGVGLGILSEENRMKRLRRSKRGAGKRKKNTDSDMVEQPAFITPLFPPDKL